MSNIQLIQTTTPCGNNRIVLPYLSTTKVTSEQVIPIAVQLHTTITLFHAFSEWQTNTNSEKSIMLIGIQLVWKCISLQKMLLVTMNQHQNLDIILFWLHLHQRKHVQYTCLFASEISELRWCWSFTWFTNRPDENWVTDNSPSDVWVGGRFAIASYRPTGRSTVKQTDYLTNCMTDKLHDWQETLKECTLMW